MANNKKRTGNYPNSKIKSSNFLPKTFQSNTNKVWLDSTLDHVISKGSLDHYDGFIGSKHGKLSKVTDSYIQTNNSTPARQNAQLLPSVVIKDNNNIVTDAITFDDVAAGIATNFDEYNYNAAYASQASVYSPPINIDMFVNYTNYYWAQNLPTYVAINTSTEQDIIELIENESMFKLVDDNNTFNLENGMIIEFSGNWGNAATDNTYIVTGVGTGIKFVLFKNTLGQHVWTNRYAGNASSTDTWNHTVVQDVTHNTLSKYSTQVDSLAMIAAYNSDTSETKPTFFDGFEFPENKSNNTKLVEDVYVRFPDLVGIYLLTVSDTTVAASLQSSVDENTFDSTLWDAHPIAKSLPEYIIMERGDSRQTAWSRINAWVSINCLSTYADIVDGFDISKYTGLEYQAKRSIIEFEAGIELAPSQQKTTVNQPPLFTLYTKDGVDVSTLDVGFKGSQVFGYKKGTGVNDVVLGFPLSYNDTPKGAEYEFENFLYTHKLSYNVSDSITNNLSWQQDLVGYMFFKQHGNFNTLYKASDVIRGAQETIQLVANDSDALSIPIGYKNIQPNYEYIVHKQSGTTAIYETNIQGTNITRKLDQYNNGVLTSNNNELEFHNIVPNTVLRFKDSGVDIEDASYTGTATVSRTTISTKLSIGNMVGNGLKNPGHTISVHFDDVINDVEFKIVIVEDELSLYHRLTINGDVLDSSLYTMESMSTIVNAGVLATDDVVDFTFINNDNSNSTQNTSEPKLWTHNSSNTVMETFTIGNTLHHWQDMMNAMPGFIGNTAGVNNFSQITRLQTYGGAIYIHNDTGIMHDIQYTDSKLSTTGALFEQGSDYDVFGIRFRNQVRRLYATTNYNTAQGITYLVQDALNALLLNKKGVDLYASSNMVYTNNRFFIPLQLAEGQTSFSLNNVANGDDNIRDHVYVWLTDNMNGDDVLVRRILVKDKDYTVTGKKINLLFTPQLTTNNTLPVVETQHHAADESSYVPQSMVKLGLSLGQQPIVQDNVLITHDGKQYALAPNADLFDMSSANYDVVNAAQYELECMIYAGLVKCDNLYGHSDKVSVKYKTINKYMPSQHQSQWYTLSHVNNYVYSYYSKWARTHGYSTVINELVYDTTDSKTWNYKSLTNDILGSYVSHLQGEQLPGHYVGIYNIIFGTSLPHINPWHMLGFSFKPQWWDTYYSWTDSTKRTALINALQNGIVSEPSNTDVTNDPSVARYAWDWTNNCPVDTSGNLIDPVDILGTPSASAAATPFVFGDWGPTEQLYRQTSECYAITLDAIVKLLPARAFTDFFQPGAITKNTTNDILTSNLTNEVANARSFMLPGTVDGKTLIAINVVAQDEPHEYPVLSNTTKVYGSDLNQIAVADIVFEDPSAETTNIDAIVINKRLHSIANDAVLSSDLIDDNLEIEYVYSEAAYVANGISQAQYNYVVRNGYNVDLHEVYSNLTTQIVQKAAGFTNKELVTFIAESSYTGSYTLSNNDYDIIMYAGYPKEIINASMISITRVDQGYSVSGISNNRQDFKFYEPELTGNNAYTENNIDNSVVKKYNNFAKQYSIAEYGTVFSKIQDVYNFIRGYFAYLEDRGFAFSVSKEAQANFFVSWAVTSTTSSVLDIELGTSVEFIADTGHVREFNKLQYPSNSITYTDGTVIDKQDLVVTREVDNTVSVSTKFSKPIGNITVAVIEYEHAFVFNDVTTLGNVMHDDIKGSRQHRLFARGAITSDWDGNKRAPGYLVFDDHIVQNFDSSVQETNDFYRTDVSEFNNEVTHAKNITIGNIERDWLNELNLDSNVVTKFYQGAIKEAGTTASVDRLARFTQGAADIAISEKYMFNHSYFGDTTRKNSVELHIKQSELNNNPQVIEFSNTPSTVNSINITDTDSRYVNNNNISFNIAEFADSNINTVLNSAGEALSTETRYYSTTMSGIPGVYDDTADYAKIQSWTDSKSYQRGETVRYKSKLYKCIVNSTGLSSVAVGITETGTKTNAAFPYNTEVVIADTAPYYLQSTAQAATTIIATGSVIDPVVRNLDQLTIDNNTLQFTGSTQLEQVIAPAVVVGSIRDPYFSTVADKSITINNTVVDFDITPDDIRELTVLGNDTPAPTSDNFNATADQTVFVVTEETLSASTWSVSRVEVDGTPTTDFTVSGQSVTITSPVMIGGEDVVISLTHQTVIETNYTIQQQLSSNAYFLNQVKIAGVATNNFTQSGQSITLTDTSSNSVGQLLEFELVHVDTGMTTNEIISKIQSANITGLTVGLSSQNTLELSYTSNLVDAELVIAPGSTNEDLGFLAAGQSADVVVGLDYIQLTMQEVVDQINNYQAFDSIVASTVDNKLVITKPSATDNLVFTTGASIFGFDSQYDYSYSDVETFTTMVSATQQINEHLESQGVTDVTLSVVSGRINVSSPRASLSLGDTNFNDLAGLPSNTVVSPGSVIENTFNEADWELLADNHDPALFNIWVVNDNDYKVTAVDSIQTKFNGWNVFQVQNHGLYTTDSANTDGCGICAGTATSDGNDAQITTNSAHGLQVGDYVMLTNTTTSPAIDGIHKVTQVHSVDSKIFYIDRFINGCGNAESVMVIRSQKFENIAQRDSAESSITGPNYKIPVDSIVYTKLDENNTRATNVYSKRAEDMFVPIRTTKYRVLNNDVENITIYDNNKNYVVKKLELFDPLRGVVPGVAQAEIDMTSDVDLAAYNSTSDTDYSIVEQNYWAEDQVGKRWWNTSTSVYYDYDQSDYSYQSAHWGKLFPGTYIEVCEWVKSTVPPEEYSSAVDNNVSMFGTVATGEAYSVYDAQLEENIYYYSSVEEWNNSIGDYTTVYYFWVRNKSTIPHNRMLSATEVTNVIENPTANGISWFAALTPTGASTYESSSAFIVSNANMYMNNVSSVLQINQVPDGINHNSWTTIARGSDLIPDYYYIGLRNNLATIDAYDASLPGTRNHMFNSYGDDRRLQQAWFVDHARARENTRIAINTLLQDVNIYKDLLPVWDTEFKKASMPSKTWKWTSFISKERNTHLSPTVKLNFVSELSSVDTATHTVAYVYDIDADTNTDRSEIWEYTNNNWLLVEKKNATIELTEIVSKARGGWDAYAWDSTTYDNTETAGWWRAIIDSCRYDWFTGKNTYKFNDLFFASVDYVLSEQNQPNWVHKSTFVKLQVTNNINSAAKKYTRSTINSILGYVNTLKPFHTKIDNVIETHSITENVSVNVGEEVEQELFLDFGSFTRQFTGTINDSIGFNDTDTDVSATIDSGTFLTDAYVDTYDNSEFVSSDYASSTDPIRQHLLNINVGTVVGFKVQTNTDGNTVSADSRTFAMVESDQLEVPMLVSLTASKSSVTSSAVAAADNVIVVTDASSFTETGIVYINNEFVSYNKNGNQLIVVERGAMGTYASTHVSGSTVTDVTSTFLTTSEQNTILLNDIGSSILTSTDSLTAVELQAHGLGIEL